jgi:hypothetical protein
MYTGSMVGAGSHVFAVWGYCISHARDSMVDLNPKLLAPMIGDTEERIRQAIEYLCREDPESRTPAEQGRRLVKHGPMTYFVVTHEKYRELHKVLTKREQDAGRKRRQRDRERDMSRSGCDTSRAGCDSRDPDPAYDPDPDWAEDAEVEERVTEAFGRGLDAITVARIFSKRKKAKRERGYVMNGRHREAAENALRTALMESSSVAAAYAFLEESARHYVETEDDEFLTRQFWNFPTWAADPVKWLELGRERERKASTRRTREQPHLEQHEDDDEPVSPDEISQFASQLRGRR